MPRWMTAGITVSQSSQVVLCCNLPDRPANFFWFEADDPTAPAVLTCDETRPKESILRGSIVCFDFPSSVVEKIGERKDEEIFQLKFDPLVAQQVIHNF